jgi:uncharacterized membrane protein
MEDKNPTNKNKNLKTIYICHRRPERSFKIRNYYFPVCARCTGIYLGIFSFFIFDYFFNFQYDTILILAAAIMILPTFLDGLTQFFNFRESNNTLRCITGLMAGIGIGILIIFLILFFNSK